jgi:NAD(P)H-dependent FMN reductase
MTHTSKVQVIIGSTRVRRICPAIAAWVAEVGREILPGEVELVDLKDWPLPMDDEPEVPARGVYANAHTRAWSAKIAEGAAYVLVSPQYNWGYPAPLKNALDHLYQEWTGKPAMIVTYGSHGGGRCAAQLRQVLEGLRMKPIAAMPGLKLAQEAIIANTGLITPAEAFAEQLNEVRGAFEELKAALANQRA